MSRPKVAIITRTKDRTVLLERAIKSVEAQTFSDYVHVVLNDGGDPKVVDRLVAKHKNAKRRVIHNKKNVGLVAALNQAIQSVDSQYVSILDDDDTWAPEYLQKSVEHLDKTGAKGVVTVIDRIVEKFENGDIKFVSKNRWRVDIREVSLYGQCIDNYAPTVAFVYQRGVYGELKGYDETLGVVEDWDFALRFLLKYDIDFLNTEEALAHYHHRPEAKGPEGNTVFAGVDEHKKHLNMLANKYLREDINEGRFGVGYIMNKLRWQRNITTPELDEKRDKQTVRLEGHINYTAESLRKAINEDVNNRRYSTKVKRRLRNK